MQKKFKVLFIFFIILLFLGHVIYATDIDTTSLSNAYNQSSNTTNATSNTTNNTNSTNTTSTSNTVKKTTNTTTTTPNVTSSSLPEADLGFSNILNIILIVIGVLLFFLGIAILIRLK